VIDRQFRRHLTAFMSANAIGEYREYHRDAVLFVGMK
jgi:hypothetical protein